MLLNMNLFPVQNVFQSPQPIFNKIIGTTRIKGCIWGNMCIYGNMKVWINSILDDQGKKCSKNDSVCNYISE